MKKLPAACLPMLLGILGAGEVWAQLKAFPGAEGYGSLATGGRGGEVYIVTTTNNTGAGSFREAVTTAGAIPRTVVFAVGGTIMLGGENDRIRLNNKANVTIAGQTAPGGGIMLRNGLFHLSNCNNIIVRHLRIRYGTSTGGDQDATWISDSNNIIFDHVSSSWGMDECLSVTDNVTNITLQNCLIAEGLRADHQYGSLINSETTGGGRITLWRNLYHNQDGRTPRAASQNGEDFLLEMVNNVVYNWGRVGDWGTQSTVSGNERSTWNMVNNYHIAGPTTFANALDELINRRTTTILRGGAGPDRAYLSGNVIDSNRNGSLDGVAAGWGNTQGNITQLGTAQPVAAFAQIANLQTAAEALQSVITDVGCRPWNRDAVDARLITELQSYGTQGSVKTSVPSWPTISGGTAPTDTDRDGMPDCWEGWYGTDPLTPSNNILDPDGYTALEHYLQWIIDAGGMLDVPCTPQTPTSTPTPTASGTASATATPSATASASATATQTATQTPTLTPSPTLTPIPSQSPTATGTPTESPSPSVAPSMSPSASPSPTPTLSPTATPTASLSPSPAISTTPTPTPPESATPTTSPTGGTGPVNDAAFQGHTLPPQLDAGISLGFGVSFMNTGTSVWTPASEHALAVLSDACGVFGGAGRIMLADGTSVSPGSEIQFIAAGQMPQSTGVCVARVQLVEGPGAFFGPEVELIYNVVQRMNSGKDWTLFE